MSENPDKKHERPVNKANMDEPQEEFIAPEARPSQSKQEPAPNPPTHVKPPEKR